MSKSISKEQFRFLFNKQILNVVGSAQEGLQSIKLKKFLEVVMKIDLDKAYDKVNWNFHILVLLQISMSLKVVNWIMGYVPSTFFVVLIDGCPLKCFKDTRGLRQGSPLSPFLFLLVAKCFESINLFSKVCKLNQRNSSSRYNMANSSFVCRRCFTLWGWYS